MAAQSDITTAGTQRVSAACAARQTCLDIFRQRLDELVASGDVQQTLRGLSSCGGGKLLPVFRQGIHCVQGKSELNDSSRLALRAAQKAAWEKLHTGYWKDVPGEWRDAYGLACLLAAGAALLEDGSVTDSGDAQPRAGPREGRDLSVTESLRQLDMGVLMGGPKLHGPMELLATAFHDTLGRPGGQTDNAGPSVGSLPPRGSRGADGAPTQIPTAGSDRRSECDEVAAASDEDATHREAESDERSASGHSRLPAVPLPPGSLERSDRLIEVLDLPSIEDFLLNHMLASEGSGKPVVIAGGMEAWPALSRWKNLDYLQSRCGLRTVPVELGQHYLDEGWTQELMTVSSFIETYVRTQSGSSNPDQPRGYLAQHPLFEQIPALKQDIMTPEYCALGNGEMQSINAWFGPAGTVSCLHHDPHQNLLAQVVGRKYLRLFPPSATAQLYPHEGMNSNTSQVDVGCPDFQRFPEYHLLEFVEAVLLPGQMLYIPPGWWHYVESLDVSFSVSFWWR